MRSGTVATMPPEAATPARKTVARVTALLVGLALTSLIGFRLAPLGGSTTATIWQAGTPLAGAPGRTESTANGTGFANVCEQSGDVSRRGLFHEVASPLKGSQSRRFVLRWLSRWLRWRR